MNQKYKDNAVKLWDSGRTRLYGSLAPTLHFWQLEICFIS